MDQKLEAFVTLANGYSIVSEASWSLVYLLICVGYRYLGRGRKSHLQ